MKQLASQVNILQSTADLKLKEEEEEIKVVLI